MGLGQCLGQRLLALAQSPQWFGGTAELGALAQRRQFAILVELLVTLAPNGKVEIETVSGRAVGKIASHIRYVTGNGSCGHLTALHRVSELTQPFEHG